WINISSLQGLADQSVDRLRAQSVIAAAGPLRLIFPTLPGAQDRDRMDPELGKGIDDLLARHSLSIEDEAQCRLMRSSGLAGTASRRTREGAADTVDAQGFWLCPLARHASPRVIPAVPVPQRTEDVFDRLERLCPRIFRPGEVASSRVPGGAVRGYPGSDFKLYVLDQGEVWYKYLRALNPVLLGRVDAILEPAFTMDCNRIPGRSGLPWERGI
ncbi:MAG: hypothetical protein ACJ8EY_02030, partial [Sphingomicrobium sp.]